MLQQGAEKAAANKATPPQPEKTPTLCLFERFERLTLGTPSTAAPNTTAAGLGQGMLSGAPKSEIGSAGSISTVSSADSEQCVARVKPARRSVAFGTPSVLAYTPAQPGQEAAEADGDDGRTPLWSNAGQCRKHSCSSTNACRASLLLHCNTSGGLKQWIA